MASQTTSSVNLLDIFCQDPVFGSIDRYLVSGGSWFEADQMYWRTIQQKAVEGLRDITVVKATKSNQERAENLLNQLKDSSTQLFPTENSMAVFQRANSVVQAWSPPTKTPVAVPVAGKSQRNTFALLDADSEEE